jgi:hypothetical protein
LVELIKNYNYVIEYHLEKANAVVDTLSQKIRMKGNKKIRSGEKELE